MIEKLTLLMKKYREVIMYLIFGVLTTLVNIAVYWLLASVLGLHYMAGTVIAWIVSVAFAYVTNRVFVFKSKAHGAAAVLREIGLFVGCRLLSGVFDVVCMFVSVDLLHINDMLAKLLSNVVVVILNYIFSKLLIFRK